MYSECSQNVVRIQSECSQIIGHLMSQVILGEWRATQINPRPVQTIKEALWVGWMDGWMGWDWLSQVVGSLRAPQVLIRDQKDIKQKKNYGIFCKNNIFELQKLFQGQFSRVYKKCRASVELNSPGLGLQPPICLLETAPSCNIKIWTQSDNALAR